MPRRRALLALGFVVTVVAGWLLWPAAPAPPPPGPERSAAPTRASPGLSFRAGQGGTAPSATVAPVAPAGPCVRGRVLNAVTSQGIAGAQVVMATARGALEARTDPAGAFELSPPEGPVSLAEVSAPGFLAFRPAWGHSPVSLTLSPGVCVSDLVLTLAPRLEYRGLVLGPDGAPVGGAEVTVATADEPPGPALVTAADGTFTFSAPEGAVLEARHPRFEPGSAEVDFRVGVTRQLVLRLGLRAPDAGWTARVALTGVVLDGRDAGVPGAQVSARRSLAGERLEGTAECDADGRFQLDLDPPGPWTLAAQAGGVRSTTQVTDGEPVVLRLLAGAELRGLVTDRAGRAVQSFSVLLLRRLDALRLEGEEARHVVDPAGRFAFAGLAPGPVEVVVAALGYAPSEAQGVELTVGSVRELTVTLREGGSVAGTVVDRERRTPLPGARVSLESGADSTTAVLPQTRTDADGGFLLGGVAPGRRSLFVAAEGHHARLLTVETREGQTTGPLLIDLGAIEPGDDPRLELAGIGAVLQPATDALLVKMVVPGGGAAEAGLVAGDAVLAIDGERVERLGFAASVERIRGPEGTTVQLSVRLSSGGTVERAVTRRRVAQ